MTNDQQHISAKVVLALSIPLILLIAYSCSVAILSPNFYYKETLNWQAQSIGQDYIDLFLVMPLLLVSSLMVAGKISNGKILWAGANMYLVYTYLIYCFDVHFNQFFIVYCLILGLSFYSLLYFFYSKITQSYIKPIYNAKIRKTIAIYFIGISILFYILWLLEILPAISDDTIPKSLLEVGAFTNPVHVIDLAIFLPGVLITGIMLLNEKQVADLLAPIILVFFVLMDITIGVLALIMKYQNITSDITVSYIMAAFALFSAALLIWFMIDRKKHI